MLNSDENLPFLQYNFYSPNGSRSNQIISLVNDTKQPIPISSLTIITNVDIENPWGSLGPQWKNVKKTKIDDTHYSYTLNLTSPLQLKPGETQILEYGVGKGLGPIQDKNGVVVAMAPNVVQVGVNNKYIDLTWVAANNPQPNPHPDFEFNDYHANWGQYSYKRTMADEQFSAINCLTYAFIGFDAQGNVFSLDSWGDQLELPTLQEKKAKYPHLQPTLAFGGWTNGNQRMDAVFSKMAADPNARKKFVQNAVNAVVQAGVNGIDIDWEYVKPADANNFISLLTELRQALKAAKIPNPRLTITGPASVANINVFTKEQWNQIANTVDRISVMAYDYYGGFSEYAEFHSPMNLSSHSPYNNENGDWISKTFETYSQMGIPKNKLTLGIPNYSRAVIVQEPGQYAGLYQKVLGSPNGDYNAPGGVFTWDTLWKFLNKQPSNLDKLGVKEWYFYDSSHPLCQEAGMCMLSGQLPNGQWVMINFHDQTSASQRAQVARSNELAGVMQWANYFDTLDPKNSITEAISNALPGQSPINVDREYENSELKKAIAPTKLEKHKIKLHSAILAEKKPDLISELITKKDNKEIFEFIRANKDELGRHRNIFKRALQIILPESLGNSIIGKTKSLTLAENYSTFIKVASTNPTKIICRDHREIVPLSFNKVRQTLSVPYMPPVPSAPRDDTGSNSSDEELNSGFPKTNSDSTSLSYSGGVTFLAPNFYNNFSSESIPHPSGSIERRSFENN